MTTPILTHSADAPRSVLPKLIGILLLIALAGVMAVLLYLYAMAKRALPQLHGELKVSGLTSKVTVARNEHGLPTIEASNLDDLFLAQGYVTAQDRLWQMDAMRLFAAGELSEILGPSQIHNEIGRAHV